MKKMMTLVAMVMVAMAMMMMPVMAAETESENKLTEWQSGQLEICNDELYSGYEITLMQNVRVTREGDYGYHVTTGSYRAETEHYYVLVYYTKDNQNGYGSVYFKDGTYIASFSDASDLNF